MSIWQCQAKGNWGPFDPECPADFTPCFEDTFIRLIPAAFLVLAGIPRLVRLAKQESVGIVALIAISTVSLVLDRIGNKHGFFHSIGLEFLAAIGEIATLILAFGLTVAENKKNYLSSNVLLVYWLLFILSSAVKLRTLTFGCPLSILSEKKDLQVTVGLLAGKIADALLVFVLECFRKDAGVQLGDDSF
ncbi:hypothetical protein BGX30_006561, partial [Mortierella sp. GBA39]